MSNIIKPNWPAPSHIQAFTTTRAGGVSQYPYASFNLAQHVNDDPKYVRENRFVLCRDLTLAKEPHWLNQTHSNTIIHTNDYQKTAEADGCYTTLPHEVCVILTADCLPILLTNAQGNFVMAIHGGWRGLASGILEKAIKIAMQFGREIFVWLGPAISQQHYQIGEEVLQQFVSIQGEFKSAFKWMKGSWYLDLFEIAQQQCKNLGVTQIFTEQQCTYANNALFYSYRRDGITGRMATGIFMTK